MDSSDKDSYYCDFCGNPAREDDDFCPDCGAIFINDVKCLRHSMTGAEGVCVICTEPFCEKCGSFINKLFLCHAHERYEIIQGMARVYGINDTSQAELVTGILKEKGFHPFIYSKKSNPLHMGNADYTLFRAAGDYNGHTINELKVMVPCQEVLEAEQVLRDMELI